MANLRKTWLFVFAFKTCMNTTNTHTSLMEKMLIHRKHALKAKTSSFFYEMLHLFWNTRLLKK